MIDDRTKCMLKTKYPKYEVQNNYNKKERQPGSHGVCFVYDHGDRTHSEFKCGQPSPPCGPLLRVRTVYMVFHQAYTGAHALISWAFCFVVHVRSSSGAYCAARGSVIHSDPRVLPICFVEKDFALVQACLRVTAAVVLFQQEYRHDYCLRRPTPN